MNQSVLTPGGAIRPMFSNRDLLLLIWPLIAEQFLSLTVGMADIVMVGRLGEAAVSGVSLVDNIQILLNNLFSALSTGGAVVCAQYIGKNRPDLSSRAAKQLVYTVSVFSVTLAAAGLLFRNGLLPFVFGKIEADVMQEAQTYFLVMMFALPSIGMYNVCSALFRAQGNSRISMYIAALINVMNIGGNYLGIFVLNLGVLGAAVSTLCSRTVAAAVLFILLYRNKPVQGAEICHAGGSVPDGFRNTQAVSLRGILRIELDGRIIRHILGIGIPNGIENSMFQIGKIVVLSLIATFGTSAIAANAAANTIAGFEVLPGSAIGLAMLTVIGRCAGAGQLKEAERFTWKLMKITSICMLVLNAGILIFARPIISVYGLMPGTEELAWNMLFCHGFFSIFFWPPSFTLPNSLRALNDAKFTMVVSMLSMWFIRIGLSYVLAWTTDAGAMCSWIAMTVDWVFRGAAFFVRFKREKWMKKATI